MAFDFYNAKQELLKVASQLFTCNMKELEKDVETGDFFDYIRYDVYGKASLSPKQQMNKYNLEYNRDNQGRDFFNSFLTLVIQVGVKLGHIQKSDEIDKLKSELEYQKGRADERFDMLMEAREELRHHKMPKGTLEDEIVSLRKELEAEGLKNAKLSRYKEMVDKVVQSEKFLRESDTDS